ncbi:MAG: tRNA epoxyqueuosine(34) reductase QueG [Oligoflexia bacterium]|nr:tRNA epoxyqueuosine(34) reductase QueG [Oligoflexia bacterium]
MRTGHLSGWPPRSEALPSPDLGQIIRSRAAALGFDQVRFCDAADAPGVDHYDAFIEAGRHASMDWMVRGRSPRAHPGELLPGLRSAVVLSVAHCWPRPPDPGGLFGKVASYAWGRDYHNLVGKRLRRFCKQLRSERPGLGLYWGVDSRPIIERAWAERAGIGFIGKNCCVIVPGKGSYQFLAVLLVDQDLPHDPPLLSAARHCGTCRRCLDICPTNAFVGPHQLDARRCISYLSIEHRGPIPVELRAGMGRWVFGCDLCQEVCPHNHTPPTSAHTDLAPRPGHAWLDLPWVLDTPASALLAHFEGSPIRRSVSSSLKRNAAIVLGNLGDPDARPCLERAAAGLDPTVRDAAEWALAAL